MINYEYLENAIYSILDERDSAKYDMDTILKTAKMVWDDTAIEVTATDFKLVIDELTYEIIDYTGYDYGE